MILCLPMPRGWLSLLSIVRITFTMVCLYQIAERCWTTRSRVVHSKQWVVFMYRERNCHWWSLLGSTERLEWEKPFGSRWSVWLACCLPWTRRVLGELVDQTPLSILEFHSYLDVFPYIRNQIQYVSFRPRYLQIKNLFLLVLLRKNLSHK